ncbi:MFS transporter [Variovorax sp. PCZ-1]|uniref:MFS transporter n=1 Tax=Variovorax sp. PCZ-1 TaxID=2835533 RepID=UPI001BCD9769|nr:MFS transporter [Variovorax sp. PCZ-1]MBS7807877.1 MFS transporter [Variovorax sp. PCZ-1]
MKTTPPVMPTPWHWIALLFTAGLLASFQYAKIPYMLPGLIQQTLMTPVQQALVLSVIGIAGAVGGTFAGALCQAAGLRRTLLFGLAVAVAGSVLPLLASSYPMLLMARVIESVAHMAIVVSVPTLILMLCHPSHQPRVMAIWSCYFTLTFIIAAFAVPTVVELSGWRGVALAHAILLIAVGVLCWWMPQNESTKREGIALRASDMLRAQMRLLREGKLLAVPITFFGYTLLFVALVSVLPGLLANTPATTTRLALWLPLASLLGTVIAMLMLSKGMPGHRLVRYSAVVIVLAGMVLVFTSQRGMTAQALVMLGFVALGTLPAGIISSIPALFTSGDSDITLVNGGLVQFGNLGNFIGSPILAAMLVQWGWVSIGMYLLAGGLIVSVCLMLLQHFAGKK